MSTRGQTAQLKKGFLAAFRQCGNVSHACTTSGASRSAVYKWRARDPAFAASFREAEVEATEHLEAEAYRRGVLGVEKPVYQSRELVGTVKEYSDTLLIFLLKGRAPEKYRDRYEVKHKGEVMVDDALSAEERAAFRDYLLRRDQ